MSSERAGGRGISYALLALPVLSQGGQFRVTVIAGDHASGLMIAMLRVVVAAVALLAVTPLLRARLPRGRTAIWGVVTGILMVTIVWAGFTEAIKLAGAANASVLINCAPFFVLALERIFLGRRFTRTALVGLVMGFVGVVVMVSDQLGGGGGARGLLEGLAYAFAGAAAWSAGMILVKRLVEQHPDTDMVGLTVGQHVVGAVTLLPIAFLASSTSAVQWGSGSLWWTIVYLGVAATAAANLGFMLAVRRLSAMHTSAVVFLIPVVAILVEVALGNAPKAVTLAGMCVAIGGVALVNTRFPRLETALGGVPENA